VTFDEDDVRRALNARSAAPTPEFRGRLSASLAERRRSPERMPSLAAVAAVVLAVVLTSVLIYMRAGSPTHVAAGPSPSQSPTPTGVAGVLTPPHGKIALPAFATLSAPSRDVVWALVLGQDVYLYRSTDQGHSWEQRPLPPAAGIVDLSFVSDREGWVSITSSPAGQCESQAVQIWHTTDAGATWEPLGSHGIGAAQCKSALSFVDPLHGFLDTSDPNGRPLIYHTSDGGKTWTASAPLADPPGFTTRTGGFILEGDRVRSFGATLLVPVVGWSGDRSMYAYASTDGGATWTYQATSPNPGGTLAFITAAHWLQVMLPGQSEETDNGGTTWHASASDYDQAAPVAPQVVFADDQVGYATVRGEIKVTVDGGLHWSAINTPGT